MKRISPLFVLAAAMESMPTRTMIELSERNAVLIVEKPCKDYDESVLETIRKDSIVNILSNEYHYPHSAAIVAQRHPATTTIEYIQSLKDKAQAKRDRKAGNRSTKVGAIFYENNRFH